MVNLTVVVQDICDVYSDNEADSSRSESLEKQVSATTSAEKVALLIFYSGRHESHFAQKPLRDSYSDYQKHIHFDANIFRQRTFL